jgi:PhnB protein
MIPAAPCNDIASAKEANTMSDWKPAGYPSMSPYLICKEPEALIAFLEAAFGGTLLRRFDRPDGSLMHAEVRIDDGVVMLGGMAGAGPTGAHIHLYVQDVSAAFERAVAAGATVIQKPERKRDDDDLRAGVSDALGTTWWIATQ